MLDSMTACFDLGAEEQTIVQRAQNHDREAFGFLYKRYVIDIYRYAYSMVKRRDVAEDITAHTFEQALKYIHRYNDQGTFKSWLYTIARNATKRHFRRQNLWYRLIPFLDDPPKNNVSDTAIDIASALEKLKPAERELIVMKFVLQLSSNEMCAILGLKREHMYVKLHRVLKKLAVLLDYGDNNE